MRPGPPHGLARSFACAWTGLAEAAARDRNLRVHLAAGVLAVAFAARAPLAAAERALLVLCVAAVIAAEALNSALEAAVDLASPGRDERARVAKDAAAGGVLALAAASVLVLAAVAVPRLRELAASARALSLPAAGAAAAALAAFLLPAPRARRRSVDALLGAFAVAGLGFVARGAPSLVGVAAAACCLAIAAAGAARRHVRPLAADPRSGSVRSAGGSGT